VLWDELARRPYAAETGPVDRARCEALCPGETARVVRDAARAIERRVDLLGSEEIFVGRPVEWLRDHKTGRTWPQAYAPRVDYAELDRDSDVKLPWELSRLQWLIPAGLAYRLDGDERYALTVREVIEEWIAANPFARTVNWAIAMEAALRIVSWTWFFHVFARSAAWSDAAFRRRFLDVLYAHADFVERHLERSDVNGNHFTADATGLAFAGLFFGNRGRGRRWSTLGWSLLRAELPRQVTTDGVDFECSTAYHRLVTELFLFPALYRWRAGLTIEADVRERLLRMGEFAAAYSRPDGTTPLWGDADDGRVLPLGGQDVNDHRYLAELVAMAFDAPGLAPPPAADRSEIFWLLGDVPAPDVTPPGNVSKAFAKGGVYIMRTELDHVFIDCGPVGTAGRGGHGHNDCLAFEAVLEGVPLVTDSGTFAYTSAPRWRNAFRATAAHNTPMIDDEELNRFVHPDYLWLLINDAVPRVVRWSTGADRDTLEARHSGYERLPAPVTVSRTLVLDRTGHRLAVRDRFAGQGEHHVSDPIHFTPGVDVGPAEADRCDLRSEGHAFVIRWGPADLWSAEIVDSWVSRSYGTRAPGRCLRLTRHGPLRDLAFGIAPAGRDSETWLSDVLEMSDRT